MRFTYDLPLDHLSVNGKALSDSFAHAFSAIDNFLVAFLEAGQVLEKRARFVNSFLIQERLQFGFNRDGVSGAHCNNNSISIGLRLRFLDHQQICIDMVGYRVIPN